MRTPLLITLLSCSLALTAQDGSLDPTFAGDGASEIETNEGGSCIVQQPDGKYLVTSTAFDMYRLLPNGDLDSLFGPWGVGDAGTNLINSYTIPSYLKRQCVALQADGKFLVGGRTTTPYHTFGIRRFLANGHGDNSFGANGLATVQYGGTSEQDDNPFAIAVQPDGKILEAGFAHVNSSLLAMTVVRYDSTGTLDPAFANNGVFLLDDGSVTTIAYDMVLQPDGKIVLVGTEGPVGYTTDLLVRLMPDGQLDTGFNGNGKVSFSLSPSSAGIPTSMALLPDGRLFVGGFVYLPFGLGMAAARFQPDGAFDTSFNGTGYETVEFPTTAARAMAVAVQADGKLLLAGAAVTSSSVATDMALVRLLSDGTPDATFGLDGRLILNLTDNETITDLLTQSNGDIVFAGTISPSATRLVVVRLLSGLTLGIADAASTDAATLLVYPDPLGNEATLRYALDHAEMVSCELRDLAGHKLRTLLNGTARNAGPHIEELELDGLASGDYLLVLTSNERQTSVRITKQ